MCKNCIPSLLTNAVYSCLVFSLSTPGIIMSHLFLTLSLGSSRVLTCSRFDLALFLRHCLLFALLQAASMLDTASLWLVWEIAEGRPGCQGASKALSSIQRLRFICIQPHNSSDAQEEQTLTQISWFVKCLLMKTNAAERLQNVSFVVFAQSVLPLNSV